MNSLFEYATNRLLHNSLKGHYRRLFQGLSVFKWYDLGPVNYKNGGLPKRAKG